jgi:hypothetical protein
MRWGPNHATDGRTCSRIDVMASEKSLPQGNRKVVIGHNRRNDFRKVAAILASQVMMMALTQDHIADDLTLTR